jgi:hypothetical protein
MLGLEPATGPAQSSAPAPMDIPGSQRELDAFGHRGGALAPNEPGAVKYPGGSFGGQFSDAEFAAYLDAAKKLGAAKGMDHLKTLLAQHDAMTQKPDATRTR